MEVNLREWSDEEEYERVGIDEKKTTILGVQIPLAVVPIVPGKNLTVIAEVLAALQRIGRHPPPAIMVRPEDALVSVRTAILLGAVLPGMRMQAEALAADLADLVKVRNEIAEEKNRLQRDVNSLNEERLRVAALSLTYALGLAIVYSVLGLVAGMSGTIFGAVSSNPWVYFAMAQVLILAALAMLDVIPIRVPAFLMQRAATAGEGGRFTGALAVGVKPLGIAVDAAGRIYLGDEATGSVSVFDEQWGFLYKLGAGDGEFQMPNHIAIDSVSSWRTIRPRCAPSAARMPNS